MYKVLFPSSKRPNHIAAYLGEGMPLAMSMARDYWDLNGRDIVEDYLADDGVAGGAEIAKQEVSVLCSLVGKELVQRVVAGGLGGEIAKVAGDVGSVDEAGWESVKVDDG